MQPKRRGVTTGQYGQCGRPPVPWMPPVRYRSFATGWSAVTARTLVAYGKPRPTRPPTGYTHTARGRRPGVATIQPPVAGTFVTGAAAGMTRRAAGDCRPNRRSTSSRGTMHRAGLPVTTYIVSKYPHPHFLYVIYLLSGRVSIMDRRSSASCSSLVLEIGCRQHMLHSCYHLNLALMAALRIVHFVVTPTFSLRPHKLRSYAQQKLSSRSPSRLLKSSPSM